MKKLIKFQSEVNLQLAVSQPNQISTLRKNEPEELELIVSLMIESLASSLNATNTMNSTQVYECTLLIIEKYWMLRPEEIMYVFKKAKLGEYGTDYNRLDIMTICKWLNRYIDEERTTHFESKNQNLHPDLISQEEFDKQYYELMKAHQQDPEKFARESKERQYAEYEKKREKFINSEKEAEFQKYQEEYYRNKAQREAQMQPTQ